MLSHLENVKNAINELRNGKMIILVDHPDRENEGDLIFPAEIITPEIINFMIRNGTGIVCLSLQKSQLEKLGLNYMVPPHENNSYTGTPFTVPIEAKQGVTTGVSAQDRATTILTAIKNNVTSDDIVKPGHVFPLCAREGGVLERKGHTEGALDLMSLAGFQPAGVLCEIMNADGTMAKGESLREFAKKHQLKMLSIQDLIDYRLYHESLIADHASIKLSTGNYGTFDVTVFKEKFTQLDHMVLINPKNLENHCLVRIHSCCITGDLFGSKKCDCHQQLHYSLSKIAEEGGIIIYLNQEGRGIGLLNKIKAYALQEQGLDTVAANKHLGFDADLRQYYLAAHILKYKNIHRVKLLTNNPLKILGLQKYGISDVEREPIPVFMNEHNQNYLRTKKEQFNHFINL